MTRFPRASSRAGVLGVLIVAAASNLQAQADLTQGHYRWRNDDGPEGSGTPPIQVTATADTTTTSATDVAVAGMSITPGAGDYLVWFSSSIENTNGTTNQFVSLYLGGVQVAHTERQVTTDSSVPSTPFPVATHALLSGVTAAQTIEVRWRTTGGTATLHQRTLVVAPITLADVTQVSATADTTTTSTTDVAVAGMSITPGAGDYLVWFSGSVECNTTTTNQFVSIFLNGAQVGHTERQSFTEDSIANTSFSVASHVFLATVGAGQPIDVRWRTTGGTATMHERTLVVARVTAANIFQASATADTTTTSGADVVAPPLTVTPGAADYLAWFSGSMEATSTSTTQFASIYQNGVQRPHSERRIFTEGSIPSTSVPIASHAHLTGVGAAQAVDVRWRTTGGTATMHERTLTLQRLTSVAGATWAEAQDTKLVGLRRNTLGRLRFGISNEGASGSGPVAYRLQVAQTATCSSGGYTDVPTDSTGHWQVLDSTFITDGEATNNNSGLTDEATTFVPGQLKDAGNTTGSVMLASDAFTEIEFAIQATTNAIQNADYCFRLFDATNNQPLNTYTRYAEVRVASDGTLTLGNHDLGQVPDRFTSASSVTAVLFRFKLTRTPVTTVSAIRARYTTGGGVANADVTAGALYRDNNGDGAVDVGDTAIQTGISGAGGQLAFTGLTEDPATGTNYLVVATINNLVPGDTTTFSLGTADIDEVEAGVVEGGSITNAVHTANAAAAVYYSVGTSTADLKSGTPTVTISAGTATFTTPQPVNVGVGDEITYNGATKAYISARTSATVYRVTTATGTTPPNVAGATVNAIRRTFNSLTAATTGSMGASYLNTSDLVTGDIQLNWACYNDGPDPSKYVRIEEPWITGPTNFIRVFTPVSSDQVGVSQRHRGIAGTGYRIAPTGPAGTDFFNFILVSTDFGYVRVEGIEIDGSGLTSGENVRGLMANDDSSTSEDVRFTHNIIHDITNSTIDDSDQSRVIGIFLDNSNNSKVANNIIYNLTSVSANANGQARGIEADDPGKTHHVYNNTLYNIRATATTGAARGIVDRGVNTVFARNNYVGLVDSLLGAEACFAGPFAAENNNVSADGSATGPGSRANQSAYSSYFLNVTPGSEDFHLLSDSNTLWTTVGADLDGDPILPVTDDIDGEPRHITTPDIGADEGRVTTNYRSIGTRANYTFSTITATAGSPVVIGAGTAWRTANRGRGDRINFNGTNYTILSVDSETQLTMTSAAVANFSGGYTIARQFGTLKAWETCISGGGGCGAFPVASASLVADDRREVGIAYNDSLVPTDPDFTEAFEFEGAITDRTHDIRLTADGSNRHYGIPGAGVLINCSACLDPDDEIRISDDYVTVEWLEIVGSRGGSADGGIKIRPSVGVVLQFLLVHDNWNGLRMSGNAGKNLIIRNSIVYDNDDVGIEGDEVGDIMLVENCTVHGNGGRGIWGALSTTTITVRNTISVSNAVDFVNVGIQETNISRDATASCASCFPNRDVTDLAAPGAPPQGNGWVMFQSLTVGSENYHLRDDPVQNHAVNRAQNLSASFVGDIDGGLRVAPWDIGADDVQATTRVDLVAFEARGLDGAVELTWETGSELNNLGFHLYRSETPSGPFQRITARIVPGLGSSPEGARYRFLDRGLANDVRYYYQLEDVETTGRIERHGPVSAVPREGEGLAGPEGPETGFGAPSLITYGDPAATSFRVLTRDANGVVLELLTGGFHAEPQDDGTVLLSVPGFDLLDEDSGPAIPVKRAWVEAVAGRKVAIAAVRPEQLERVDGLRLAGASPSEIIANRQGTVRLRRTSRRTPAPDGLYPSESARLLGTGFQEDVKRAQVQLAPLRWDGSTGELVLARRLLVHLSFRGVEPDETPLGGARGRRRRGGSSTSERNVLARLATRERGLYEVRYEDIFPDRRARASIRLSRQGEPVAFHIEPSSARFGPGSRLYFLSDGAEVNPYGTEAVYEIEAGRDTRRMEVASAAPSGAPLAHYRKRQTYEENRLYQAGLVGAPDLWLWDLLVAPATNTYPLKTDDLAPSVEPARLSVWLQGTSDFEANPDHHVRVYVNGTLVAEGAWDGKRPHTLESEIGPGILREGGNELVIESVGDTTAAYSLVMLNRFEIDYPRLPIAEGGRIEGRWTASGTVSVAAPGRRSFLLDVTDEEPRWLVGAQSSPDATLSFRAEGGRTYLAVAAEAVLRSEVRPARGHALLRDPEGADYLAVGPGAFLREAQPLLEHRRKQGLRVKAAAVEDIYDSFGFGESRPEAIRDFLEHAYHEWPGPPARYVVLLGDATYDFKDHLRTGVQNRVPPLMVKTSYLWTVSDPTLGAVNGEDRLPDVAIGRLPAADENELKVLIAKILAYESGDAHFGGPLVLVADNPDSAGDFDADVAEIAGTILTGRDVREIHLSRLGRDVTRERILAAFDEGASLVSYAGHGGIHLWANENIFNVGDIPSLLPQPQQPFFVTMNCLNGYFHFPYFDSLAEALLEAEGKGAIAAFAPSGLSQNGPAHRFHEILLDQVFNGRHRRLGDAVLAAQAAYAGTGLFDELLSIYHLLGDPALELR